MILSNKKLNNEDFWISLQYAICLKFKLENSINISRISETHLNKINKSWIIDKVFINWVEPVEYLTDSKQYTWAFIRKCPHNFLLNNWETFSIKTFKSKNKMFAPKVVGQAWDDTFNHFFWHLVSYEINRETFKKFCLDNISDILPILIDYALVSDLNSWLYVDKNNDFQFEIIKRNNLPDLTFEKKDFSFTNGSVLKWNETNTVKYKWETIIELQLHTNRTWYKMRLHRENFPKLIKVEEKKINNSLLWDTAELAICNIFELDAWVDNDRLVNNSDETILKSFEKHYIKNKNNLFPYRPIKYWWTQKRERWWSSKSWIDFYLEGNNTLSLKTNKWKSSKVCPPEIWQPSPKTFDRYFSNKGWYEWNIDEEKFRNLVKNRKIVSILLKEYVNYLNECDLLLWSLYIWDDNIDSKLIYKKMLQNMSFDHAKINYSNDFNEKSSVTLKYWEENLSLWEFQIHMARNSLKFRFNFWNLLTLTTNK